ncbi:hypothetical protein QJQ45_019872 [Haematococcus lacustris]|nr:hypothetical protein QJQ45_019872 [Haematococcus lacustris]
MSCKDSQEGKKAATASGGPGSYSSGHHFRPTPVAGTPVGWRSDAPQGFVGRQLTAASDINPTTCNAIGVDSSVTQAIKAGHAEHDLATRQVLRQWEWELSKGQLKHNSGLNKAKQDTARWSAAIQPKQQQLAAATPAGTTLDGLQAHILALKATWDALWEEYLKPRWRRQRLGLHHARERVIEGFCKKGYKVLAKKAADADADADADVQPLAQTCWAMSCKDSQGGKKAATASGGPGSYSSGHHFRPTPVAGTPVGWRSDAPQGFVGRQLTATSDINPTTCNAIGVDSSVTQAIKAGHAEHDLATRQVLRQWEWELSKGQLKHNSGLNKAKQDTARWSAAIQPKQQQLAAATPAGTTLDGLQAHILALKATWDALWEEYLKPRWRRQRLGLHHARERVIEGFCKKRSHAAADAKSPGTKRVAGGSSTRQTRTEYAKQVEAVEECDREARNTRNTGATPRGDNDIEHNNSRDNSGSIGSSSSCDSEDVGEDRAQPAAEGFTANHCKLMVDAIISTWHLPRLVQLLAHVVPDYAFKQFVKREFEAASKSLGAPSLRTAIGNPVGSLAFLVACAAGFDKDSVVDHQLKEGLAGKPVMPLLLVDHMAFTNFKLYYRLTDLYRQVTGEKEPYKELMASNHNALMLQFREVLLNECKAFGWENIDNVRVCGMQGLGLRLGQGTGLQLSQGLGLRLGQGLGLCHAWLELGLWQYLDGYKVLAKKAADADADADADVQPLAQTCWAMSCKDSQGGKKAATDSGGPGSYSSLKLRAYLGLNLHIPVNAFHHLLASSTMDGVFFQSIADAYEQLVDGWGDEADRAEALEALLDLVEEQLIDPPSHQAGLDPALVLGSKGCSSAKAFATAFESAVNEAIRRGTLTHFTAINHLFSHCLQVPTMRQEQRTKLRDEAVRLFHQAVPDAEDRQDQRAFRAALHAVSAAHENLLDSMRYVPATADRPPLRAEQDPVSEEVLLLRQQLAELQACALPQPPQRQRARQPMPQPLLQPMPHHLQQPMQQMGYPMSHPAMQQPLPSVMPMPMPPMQLGYAAMPQPALRSAPMQHAPMQTQRSRPAKTCPLHPYAGHDLAECRQFQAMPPHEQQRVIGGSAPRAAHAVAAHPAGSVVSRAITDPRQRTPLLDRGLAGPARAHTVSAEGSGLGAWDMSGHWVSQDARVQPLSYPEHGSFCIITANAARAVPFTPMSAALPAAATHTLPKAAVTQAIKAGHAEHDLATRQVLRQWEWQLSKGQLKHNSGLNKAKQDTARWSAAIQPQQQQLAAATPAGTTLDGLQAHVLALKATWDALWEEYLKPRWRRQRLGLHHARERVIEGFCKKV